MALAFLFALTFSLAIYRPLWAADDVARSVVKILANQQLPDLFKPWTRQSPREAYASGVVIEGNHILTNAHVVAFASQIYVQPYQSTDKIAARVVAEAPGVDLALLELKDDSFFQAYGSLPFAQQLPKAKDTVNVYGYPIGGQEQSVTEGIVSRIGYAGMNYSVSCLQIQIDAALNPGNSGGPAVSDGKMIGLVCSKIQTAENIGYLIPVEEIEIFLKDIADGTYDGQPAIQDVSFQTVENDALRSLLELGKDRSGVLVTRVQNSRPDFPLKPWDLITHIGEYAIDSEGRVRVHGDLQLPASYLVPRLAEGGKVAVTMVRNGVTQRLQVPVSAKSGRLIRFAGHEYPRYFIYGPLIFTAVTDSYIRSLSESQQAVLYMMLSGSPMVTRLTDLASFEGEELVGVVPPMFPHRVSKGYDLKVLAVVSHVNDVKVKNLVHLVEMLRDSRDEYVVFRFAGLMNETLVFRREEIEAAAEEILSDYGIRHQCSEDLRGVWEKRPPK